jgi:hypothetical protein
MTSFTDALKARTKVQTTVPTVQAGAPSTQIPQPAPMSEEVAQGITYQQALQTKHPAIQKPKIVQPGAWEEIRDIFTGELRGRKKTADLPEVSLDFEAYKEDFLGSVKATLGMLVAADDEGRANVLKERFPDIDIQPDEFGNQIATLPNGEKAILNRPGMSANDLYQIAFDAAWFAGPGKLTAAAKTIGGKAALGAAGASGAEYTRQEISGALGTGEEIDPTRIGLAGMAGAAAEFIPAGLRARSAAKAEKRAGVIAEDIAGVEPSIKRAEEITEATGIPLFRAQKTGHLTDQGRQSFVASLPSASQKAAKSLEAQNKAAYDAVVDLMDNIAPVENIETAARNIRKAAKTAIRKEDKIRSSAAGRYYKEAFTDETPVALEKTFGVIDKVKSKYEPGTKTYKLMERVEKTLNRGAETAGNIQKRHNSKMEIDDIFKEFGDTGAARTGKGELTKVKKALVAEMREANPNYDEARKIFAQLSPKVQRATEGKIGQLAALDENQLKTVASKLFDPTQQAVDPASIRRAKKMITDLDPDAWNDIVRTEMQRRLGKTGAEGVEITAMENIPGQLYNKIFKGENGKTLMAALDGDAAKNAKYLEEGLKRASKGRPGGSQTGERSVFEKELRGTGIVKGLKRLITKPAETIGEIGEDVTFDMNSRALAEVMFDPKWTQDMAKLRRLNPNSKEAERRFISIMRRALKSAAVSQAPEAPEAVEKTKKILED